MIPATDFMAALRFASHAKGVREVRPYLNGVLFRFTSDRLELVGTDGHRLAVVGLETTGCQPTGDYIVKNDAVDAVTKTVKLKADSPDLAKLEPAPDGSGALLLTVGVHMFALPVLNERYPDYERIVRRDKPVGVPGIGFNLNYMAEAMKAFKPLAHPKFGGMLMETWGAVGSFRLSVGDVTDRFPNIVREPHCYIMPMRL